MGVQTTLTFKANTPRPLFTPPTNPVGTVATSDLKRFLALVPVEGAPPRICAPFLHDRFRSEMHGNRAIVAHTDTVLT